MSVVVRSTAPFCPFSEFSVVFFQTSWQAAEGCADNEGPEDKDGEGAECVWTEKEVSTQNKPMSENPSRGYADNQPGTRGGPDSFISPADQL